MEKLKTIDGRYAVGYTIDDCIYRHDRKLFKKIDKDGNGTLSDTEIIARRKKEARTCQIPTVISLAVGLPMTLSGLNKKSAIAAIVGVGFCLMGAYNQGTINSEKDITETYEKEHKLNTNG